MQRILKEWCQQKNNIKMYKCLLLIALLFALISCKKKEAEKPYSFLPIIDCSLAQYPDSLTILQKLQGSWQWKKYGTLASAIRDADKNITLTFDSDSTFSVVENSNTIQQGTFRIINYSTYYGLRSEPYSGYIGGSIYFCDNQLLFINSIVDGSDNLFER